MSDGIYWELIDLLLDPTGDPSGIKQTPVQYGKDILSFCPIHESSGEHHRRSLKLSQSRIGLHCFALCDFDEIVEALYRRANLPLHSRRQRSDQNLSRFQPRAEPHIERYPDENLKDLYQYRVIEDGEWKVVGEKGRFEFPVPGQAKPSKIFGWRIPSGTWGGGLKAGNLSLTDMPLYDLKDFIDARDSGHKGPIWITEGEAARRALVTRGVIALCPPGGASSKEFGDAFAVLAGRDVVVWPDNDEPGRVFAGSVARAATEAGASSVRTHIPSIALPPKGDAVEYFQMGGSLEDLERQTISEPVPEILAGDAVAVHHPSNVGVFHWEFHNVVIANHSVDGRLSVWLDNPSFSRLRPYTQRINIDSASAVDLLRRTLENYFDSAGGKDLRLVEMINTVFALFREELSAVEKGIDVADLTFDEEQDIEIAGPLAVADGHTIWYGDGGSSKSFAAYGLAVAMAYGLPFAGQKVRQGRVLIVDWEGSKNSFGRRLQRILKGYGIPRHEHGRVIYRAASGIPINEIIDDLRQLVDDNSISFAILDSIGPACGGEPEKAEIALRYFSALHRLGVPTLSIAHITKAGEESKPIGSVFYHNAARRTFFLLKASDSTVSDLRIGFFCKKVNDGTFPQPIGVRIQFDDRSILGAVTFDSASASMEGVARKELRYQIHDVLDAPLEIDEIIGELGMPLTSAARSEVFKEIQAHITGGSPMFYSEQRSRDGLQITVYGRAEAYGMPGAYAQEPEYTGTDGFAVPRGTGEPQHPLEEELPRDDDERWRFGSAVWEDQ